MYLTVLMFCGYSLPASAQNRYHGLILEKGMTGEAQTEWIMLLQYDLYFLGYGVYFDNYRGVTGEYHDQTLRAVKAFQSDHGLIADGMVGKKTTIAIEKALEETEMGQNWKSFNPMRYKGQRLRKGDLDELCGKSVNQLKSDLTALGYSVSGDSPGVFGDATDKALKEFQEINLLPSTGVTDDRTVVTIAEKICVRSVQKAGQ